MEHSKQSDEELVAAWQAGDQRAGATLVSRHYEAIARFFIHRLGAEAEDLVHETFMGFQRGLDRYRGECSPRIYLFKIARYQLLSALRSRARDQERFDPGVTTMAGLDPSATALLVANEQHKLLVAALRSLPIDVQMMLELHYWEQLKIQEIAEVLDMNVNNVKSKMKRGRERLQVEMKRLAESPEQLQTTLHQIGDWVADLREKLGESDGIAHPEP